MANKLPPDIRKAIQKRVFAKADEFGYGARSRTENGAFLNTLAEDAEIGGILREYMSENAVRTYIKDGVLNAYAKAEVRKKLNHITNEVVIKKIYNTDAYEVGKNNQTCIYRDSNKAFYLIHSGTYLKWETALRKLLECVASADTIKKDAETINLCLVLTVSNGEITFADQELLEKALDYIHVKVYFAR